MLLLWYLCALHYHYRHVHFSAGRPPDFDPAAVTAIFLMARASLPQKSYQSPHSAYRTHRRPNSINVARYYTTGSRRCGPSTPARYADSASA